MSAKSFDKKTKSLFSYEVFLIPMLYDPIGVTAFTQCFIIVNALLVSYCKLLLIIQCLYPLLLKRKPAWHLHLSLH